MKQNDLLFHSTTAQLAISILRHGGLLPSSNGFISFTRDPELWFGNDEVGGGHTQFVFDRADLLRFAPSSYDYHHDGLDASAEAEERVRCNSHRPLNIKIAKEIWSRDTSPLTGILEEMANKCGLPIRRMA